MSTAPGEKLNAAGELLPECLCPCCSKVLDAATAVDPKDVSRPQAGDYSVCFGCGSFLRFQPDGRLRLLTMTEMALLDDDSRNELMKVRRSVVRFKIHQALSSNG